MDTQHSVIESTSPHEQQQGRSDQQLKPRSLVPKGITIGLAIFALVLSLAGYGFRLLAGDNIGDVLRHAAVLVPAFVLGIPFLFWVGSRLFNKLNGTHIESRNAISLGYLTACISMLWLMGGYS